MSDKLFQNTFIHKNLFLCHLFTQTAKYSTTFNTKVSVKKRKHQFRFLEFFKNHADIIDGIGCRCNFLNFSVISKKNIGSRMEVERYRINLNVVMRWHVMPLLRDPMRAHVLFITVKWSIDDYELIIKCHH